MHDPSLLKQWRSIDPSAVISTAARRVFGVYATLPAAGRHRLVLRPDGTYCLEQARDNGMHWALRLQGRYHLPGYELRLELPATRRGQDYAWCARLLLQKDRAGSIQELVPAGPLSEAEAPPGSFCRQEYPLLLRCIGQKAGRQTFANSLVVGNTYVALGLAQKAGYVEVLNEQQRIRKYPAAIFRRYE